MGPYHPALPKPLRLNFELRGQYVAGVRIERGYLHRGLEKISENLPWRALIAYADHLNPENAISGEMVLCQAVESLWELSVPPRARAIRLILCELGRVSSHLLFLARMARVVGLVSLIHLVLRDRERILDLFELATGARHSLHFLRYGGLATEVTEGFIERVQEVGRLITYRLQEYDDLLGVNPIFTGRTRGIGVLSKPSAARLGLSGPNGRASGILGDVRKQAPYSGYDQLAFEVGGDQAGDVAARFAVRRAEIPQSVAMLEQLVGSLPRGAFRTALDPDAAPPAGEAYARVESSGGKLCCYVRADGSARAVRIQYCTPSAAVLEALPEALGGAQVDDIAVILASFHLCVAEVDK